MARKPLPTPEQLRQLLDYNPETGALTWKPRTADMFSDINGRAARSAAVFNATFAGRPALTFITAQGRRKGTVAGVQIFASRVAWAVTFGTWPRGEVDHINGNTLDDRLANLRDVSKTDNARNCKKRSDNSSGRVGVHLWRENRWGATIGVNGRNKFLGIFHTKEEAAQARQKAEIEHGYHKNHGRSQH